jgi:HTH-type transcriptional regulator/antitoxin HigA
MNAIRKIYNDAAARFNALNEIVPLHSISSQEEYDRAQKSLDELLDAGAADESHPLAPIASALGDLMGAWEDVNVTLPDASPAAVLRFLMDQHGLRQSDLPEIGSQGVVSQILREQRQLTVNHIVQLSARFGVSPVVFLPGR